MLNAVNNVWIRHSKLFGLFQTKILIMTFLEQEGGLHSVQKHIYTDRQIYGYPRAPKTSSKSSNRKEILLKFKEIETEKSRDLKDNGEMEKMLSR